MTQQIQPHGSPDSAVRKSPEERYKDKLTTYGEIVRDVTTARLSLYQRFTTIITLGTFVLDAKIITATTDLRPLMIINAPALFSVLVAGFLEIYARFRTKSRPKSGRAGPSKDGP